MGVTWVEMADAALDADEDSPITNKSADQIARHLTLRWFMRMAAFLVSFLILAAITYSIFWGAAYLGAGLKDIAFFAGDLLSGF